MAVIHYCTWADVTNRISSAAADARTDDAPSTAPTDILDEAAIEVNGYLQINYDVATLAQSNWVRFKCRDIAVFLLCGRRNHPIPVSVQERYDKAIKDLEKCQTGEMRLPDVAEGKANVPVLSNQRVSLQPFPRVQNEPGISTGKQQGYSPNNDDNQFDYSQP